MTTHLRNAIGCTAGHLILTTGAAALLYGHHPWLAGTLLYGAILLAWGARCEHRCHRRLVAEHAAARHRAPGDQTPAPAPCCLLADTSNSQAHDRQCTRPRPYAHFAGDPGQESLEQLHTRLGPALPDGDEPPSGRHTGGQA